jgi:biotin transport system substrate-specific component
MSTIATGRLSLAEALFPSTVPSLARNALLIIAGIALMTLAAKVKVPFYPVPVTLQTLALPLIAGALGARLGFATMIAYLAAGVAGAPVFANTPPAVAGPAYFFGPTAGYLVAYPIAAYLIGALTEGDKGRSLFRLFGAMVLGGVIVFTLGWLWLAFFATLSSGATGMGGAAAFVAGVQNFILADLVKAALAAALIVAGWKVVDSFRS